MVQYYTMSDERTEQIAAVAGISAEQVREYALADWNEGGEHQRWLDTAPAQEVADWILAGRDE